MSIKIFNASILKLSRHKLIYYFVVIPINQLFQFPIYLKTVILLMTQKLLREELQITVQYYNTLQQSFENNLQVIEEQDRQIQCLNEEVHKLKEHQQQAQTMYRQREEQYEMEIRIIHEKNSQLLEEREREMEEMAVMMQTRMRKEVENVNNRMTNQGKMLRNQVYERDQTVKRLLADKERQSETNKEQKSQLLELQSRLQQLTEQKNACANKMVLHLQQLEGVRNNNQEWEEMLKAKLRETQREKQQVEEEMSQMKLAFKEKLKKQKQQNNKKLVMLAQEKQNRMREIITEHKEMKYKYQKMSNELKDSTKLIQNYRDQKAKLQGQLDKYKDNEMKSNYQKNQKEYDYFLKIFEQDKRDLRNQIDVGDQEKKMMKEELAQVNAKRQNVEKALERLKVELLNRSKENDQLKKDNRKLRLQYQSRLKQYQAAAIQMRQLPFNIPNNISDHKGFDSLKIQNDYSKVFTQDMGIIDDKYFEASSPFKSPKNIKNSYNNNANREAIQLKRISELQLQNQQLKTLIKKIRQEAETVKKICEEEKNREISLYRDKANIYWEKANDKEQQVMGLREQLNQSKSQLADLAQQLKTMREDENKNKESKGLAEQYKTKIAGLQQENAQLLNQIKMIENQRRVFQEISAELKIEVNWLKQKIQNIGEEGNWGQENNYNYDQTQPYHNQMSEIHPDREETHSNMLIEHEKQKIPKKLHDLVREKKLLSISGKRAAIQQRTTEVRYDHIGTDSQKQILQKIKVRNKTPPKVANYAEMKKQKERRSHQLQTASQKQVLQKLKARQGLVPEPERGVNYLQLREMDGIQ